MAALKDCALADGFDAILMPGELEQGREARTRQAGIALPENVIADLDAIAADLGCAPLPGVIAEVL